MVGVFYCIVYEVVYIIRVSTVTFRILYIGSLHEVVNIIPVTAYTSIRLYEYLLIRVSASPPCLVVVDVLHRYLSNVDTVWL
jgi:hypothetical protein